MTGLRIAFLAVTLALFATPSLAQESPTAPAPAIATKTVGSENSDIASRIRSIFAEIDALRDVQVRVSAGVVTLRGTVPSARDVIRAETIAARVAGVVTVQNELARDLNVDTNLKPVLMQFRDHLRGLARALPLIGIALVIGLLIAMAGYLLASVGRLWRWLTPNPFLAELVATFIRFISIILAMVTALQILGATALLGAVLGAAGVIGVALGFSVRDTIDNYVSSLMLSLRQPFRANDHVVIDGHEGRVVRLTSRATILMTLDGNHLRIPNATVFKSVILNYTRNPERRFTFDLGIDADDNPIDGMAVGLAAVNGLAFVLDTPKAVAIIQDVGDSNIVLRFFGWVDQVQTDFFKGRSLAIQAAKAALENSGFALPEPIYRLRFDDAAPLPMKRVQSVEVRETRPPPDQPEAAAVKGDTSPDSHVAQLVEEERSQPSDDDDLLDSSSPIE